MCHPSLGYYYLSELIGSKAIYLVLTRGLRHLDMFFQSFKQQASFMSFTNTRTRVMLCKIPPLGTKRPLFSVIIASQKYVLSLKVKIRPAGPSHTLTYAHTPPTPSGKSNLRYESTTLSTKVLICTWLLRRRAFEMMEEPLDGWEVDTYQG